MYSWEIDSVLRKNNYSISSSTYAEISNVRTNTQITHVKYDPYKNSFLMETNDEYVWNFNVKKG